MSDSVTSVDSDLAFAGAAAQAGRLRERTVSAPELTRLCLDRIERVDPRINAFRAVRGERALAEAEAAQRRLDAGEHAPLLGVPVAIKDNTDIAGEPTRHGTRLQPEPATADSAVVARLRAAGAVIVGQTNLPELALWGHFTESEAAGVTRNPWDPERGTNGSSGGSAAAVAAGLAGLAHASDGGGSIRLPAACCGLVGLKTQRGRVSLSPHNEHWNGLSVAGSVTRHTIDTALWLDVVAGGNPAVPEPERPFADSARSAP
ncbi:MAG: amidase, partial [Thermoleophilaceae bacterium]|nr:amidase [Thermoleophilaceae bacterium]